MNDVFSKAAAAAAAPMGGSPLAVRPEQAVVDEIDALVDWQLAQGESGSSMKGMNVDGGARTVAWKVPDGVGSVAVPIAGDLGRSAWCPR